MTFEERADKAAQLKESGYNCCQAVVAALSDLTEADTDKLLQLASGFALGIGNMEGTCGALVGASMIASILTSGIALEAGKRWVSRGMGSTCQFILPNGWQGQLPNLKTEDSTMKAGRRNNHV